MPSTTRPTAFFDVSLNGQRLARASVGATGVLTAVATWVKLEGEPAATARRLQQPVEEACVDVSGLRRGTHRTWVRRPLNDGDRIAIVFGRGASADPRRARPHDTTAPQFLNVDLDLYSRTPLDALVQALGRRVMVLHNGPERRGYGAHLELATVPTGPDRALQRFAALVRALPPAAKRVWNGARAREFNIGIQASARAGRFEFRLAPETLRAIADLDARIGTTVR